MNAKFIALVLVGLLVLPSNAQVLHLPDALHYAVENYDQLKMKQQLIHASTQQTEFQKSQFLPDVTFGAQQSFGTINAQNGPLYAYGGLGSASTSMPLSDQNWNAAFGSLYFANVNWSIFTFGRLKEQVNVASAYESVTNSDLEQAIFQHQIKVGAAYLNLLASQRITYVQERNVERAKTIYELTATRARSGLIPEVDASLAKAEVAHSQSMQIKAFDHELDYSKGLAVLLGDRFQAYVLDSVFTSTLPMHELSTIGEVNHHPLLTWQDRKIKHSASNEKLIKTSRLPNVSAFGVIQGRGSGFDWNYVQDNSAYSTSYLDGVGIDRGNYLIGLSITWNISQFFRVEHRIKEQAYMTQALEHTYALTKKELSAQAALSEAKYDNALVDFKQTTIQLDAAYLAFKQHSALYTNGLTTLVDYTQTLYALNRAEVAHEVAQNNVWQALLFKAAAQGDLHILLNAINN